MCGFFSDLAYSASELAGDHMVLEAARAKLKETLFQNKHAKDNVAVTSVSLSCQCLASNQFIFL